MKTIPTKPGLYIACTPKVLAIVKIIGEPPFLSIPSAIDLTNYWRKDNVGLVLEQELAHLKSAINLNQLVLIPIGDINYIDMFDNNFAESIPLGNVEFDEEHLERWKSLYISIVNNGSSMNQLLSTIMFDGPYTLAQARLVYDYILKKLKNSKNASK